MGQNRQFKPGNKAPNNGRYIEIGETGSMVQDPMKIKLEAGDPFPETTNHNRVWTYEPNPQADQSEGVIEDQLIFADCSYK